MTKDKDKEKNTMFWNQTFVFIITEIFGEDLLKDYLKDVKLAPIDKVETLIDNVSLEDYEKNLYKYIDAIFSYLVKNRRRLPSGELDAKGRAADGLSSIWWSLIKLNHPDLQDYDFIGIREDFKLIYKDRQLGPMEMLSSLFGGKSPLD
jgi:hypothetical protein